MRGGTGILLYTVRTGRSNSLAAEAVHAAHGAGAGLNGEGGGEGGVEIEISCLGRFRLDVVFFLENRVRQSFAWMTALFQPPAVSVFVLR